MGNFEEATVFVVGGPSVVRETFDDEVVIVDLDLGAYYSIDPIGGHIHDLLSGGVTYGDTLAAVAARYDGDFDEIESSVAALTTELVEAKLLAVDPTGIPEPAPVASDGPPLPFARPVLSTYTDMTDLLMIDPIHDVDDAGWPVRADTGEA